MFIDKDSLKIKVPNGSYISLGNYIVEAKYGYNKLYGQDSGRSLSGRMSATLLGTFIKISVQFGSLTKSQLETIVPILDNSVQIVRYYDPKKQAYVEMETYTGDYEITNKGIVGNNWLKNEGFSCSFIAIDKRS